MRLAILSDVHGNLHALEAVLDDVATRGVEATLALGDFLSGPFDPFGVADRLIGLGLPAVRGNHDRWIVEGRADDWDIDVLVRDGLKPVQRDWLAALPATRLFGRDVLMTHGTPASDEVNWMDGVLPPDGRIVHMPRDFIEEQARGHDHAVLLCGHSHVPRTLRLGDGRLLVNPGSVGFPFAFGSPDAHYAIIEKRAAGWSVDLRAIPYDIEAAARLAEAAGFPSWGAAVRTGWPNPYEL